MAATALNPAGETVLWAEGLIERNTDVDFFHFTTGDGTVSITINPFHRSPNLGNGSLQVQLAPSPDDIVDADGNGLDPSPTVFDYTVTIPQIRHVIYSADMNNGSTWTTIWQNPSSNLLDSSWSLQTFDISAVADGQSTVFVRWGLGPTNNSQQFTGWYVDDVVLTGFAPPTNAAPVAVDDAYQTGFNTPLTVAAPGVLANDSDPDGDLLTAVLVSGTDPATEGAVTLNANGSFTFTPVTGFVGTASFTYLANDDTEDSNVATVTIQVLSAGDVKLFIPDDLLVVSGGSITVPVKVEILRAEGTTINSFDLVIEFDAEKFTYSSVQLGDLLLHPNTNDMGLLVNPDLAELGKLIVQAGDDIGSILFAQGTAGDLLTVTFAVANDAPSGLSPMNLLESYGVTFTGIYDNDLADLVISPAPTNAADDPIDGVVTIDGVPPTVTGVLVSNSLITDADTGDGKTFTITVDFSEPMDTTIAPVLAFDPPHQNTLTNPGGTWTASDTYTVIYGVTDQNVDIRNVQIGISGASDLAGNLQTPFDALNVFDIDTLNPSVTVGISAAELNLGAKSSTVTFTFREAVADFGLADVAVSGGTLTDLTGDGTVYTARLTANNGVETTGSVTVAAGSYADLAGNPGAGGSQTVVSDTLAPTKTVNIAATTLNLATNSSAVTFSFSEAVQGFTAEDVTVTGGVLSNFAGSGASYSATFTAADGIETTGSVTVAAGSYTDLAGNSGTGGGDTVLIDTPAPTVVALDPDHGAVNVVVSTELVMTFSEAVLKGLGTIELKRSDDGSVVQSIDVAGAAVTVAGQTVTIELSEPLVARSSFYVEVTAGAFQDLAGNDFAGFTGPTAWSFSTLGLRVEESTSTATGFSVTFSQPVDETTLNLYDGYPATLGEADATLVGDSTGEVHGSLVVSDGGTRVTFIRTGGLRAADAGFAAAADGLLAPDTYTLTLRSAENGFRDLSGVPLDGNDDGTPGGDFTFTFTVDAPPAAAIVVSLPDFARGFGQPVNLPADNLSAGLPLTISDGSPVSQVELTLLYDPALLNVLDFQLAAGVAERNVTRDFQLLEPGVVQLSIAAPIEVTLAATAGPLTVGSFVAVVPDTAPYKAKHVLDITDLRVFDVFGQELPSLDDDAIHVAAFFGDTHGSMRYQSPDATLVRRLIGQVQTGLVSYPLVDPVLLADISLNGRIASNDTTGIRRAIVQMPVANIPVLPEGLDLPAASGADPKIYIPTDLVAVPGGTVMVPVMVHVTEPGGITIGGFDVVIEFDPTKFSISSAQLGNLLTAPYSDLSGTWSSPAAGTLVFTADAVNGSEHFPEDTVGQLFTVTLAVASDASGPSPINLRASYQSTSTSMFDNQLESLVLVPAPTNDWDDPVDGRITVDSTAHQPGVVLHEDGALVITGTPGDDWIHVRPSPGDNQELEVRSSFWAGSQLFPIQQVQRIEVHAGAGDDRVYLSRLVTIDAWIDGGPGDDLLWGGSGNDVILGGEGNDRIWGRAGNNVLDGGLGDDRIWGGTGDDVLISGPGLNRLWSGSGNDQLYDDTPSLVWPDAQTDTLLGDVDGNGVLSANDVLGIVNYLNSRGQRVLTGEYHERPRLDIDGDGSVLPLDALRLINLINLMSGDPAGEPNHGGGGEGEAGPWLAMPAAVEPWDAGTAPVDGVFSRSSVFGDRSRSNPPDGAARYRPEADQDLWLTAASDSEEETADLLNVLAHARSAATDPSPLDQVFQGMARWDGGPVGRWAGGTVGRARPLSPVHLVGEP